MADAVDNSPKGQAAQIAKNAADSIAAGKLDTAKAELTAALKKVEALRNPR